MIVSLMPGSSLDINISLKKEADEILYEKNLLEILNTFGQSHVSGSYALDLMVWRDLDIYVEADVSSQKVFFEMGFRISSLLNPVKMSFRNELVGKTPGLPRGLYWGVYLGNERAGAWKIDIWYIGADECKRLMRYCDDIAQRLNPEKRLQILHIKSKCWLDPAYRKSYSSADIYTAVLDYGIFDIEGFREYLQNVGRY